MTNRSDPPKTSSGARIQLILHGGDGRCLSEGLRSSVPLAGCLRGAEMTATLEVAPTQWGRLKDLHDVDPLNDGDYDCLVQIREVLKKHGKQERFGVALLHTHFPMQYGEVLVEHTDVESRILTIKPVRQEEAGRTIETIWMLLDGENRAMMGCRQLCGADVQGNHNSFHRQT
jgi:hypothetical protein